MIAEPASSSPRWNIFARELENILVKHGASLKDLRYGAGIHQEIVRRLRESLCHLKRFPVLNPEDMDKVITSYSLSKHEVVRLQAALLATAIERMLMDRVERDKVPTITEVIFSWLLEAMKNGHAPMSGFRSGTRREGEANLMSSQLDLVLEPALEAIDAATLALQLSTNLAANAERIAYLQQAREAYRTALQDLDEVEEEWQRTEAWQTWHAEARHGLAVVQGHLEDLGVE